MPDFTEVLPKTWREQPWMAPDPKPYWDTHQEALATLRAASSVSNLSMEETVMGYMRLRGFLVDDADVVCKLGIRI